MKAARFIQQQNYKQQMGSHLYTVVLEFSFYDNYGHWEDFDIVVDSFSTKEEALSFVAENCSSYLSCVEIYCDRYTKWEDWEFISERVSLPVFFTTLVHL